MICVWRNVIFSFSRRTVRSEYGILQSFEISIIRICYTRRPNAIMCNILECIEDKNIA